MDDAAHLAFIDGLLARPLPGDETARQRAREPLAHHLAALPADGGGPAELTEVVASLRARFGPSGTVALDGFTDPSLRRLPGPPLADLLADRAIEMYGWTVGRRWLGVGLLRSADAAAPRLTAMVSAVAAPAPAGGPELRLLQWAMTSAEHSFCWLVEDPDPEKWPIFARDDKWTPWRRFDGPAGEFVHRMLTDPQHPYSLARHFDTHWFASTERAEDAERAEAEF
ncbi:hypothetical protein [Kitasatospora sp. NPDC093806]|uniref:hypothetical protein n=1 Tax=Kitasatospora sp. NPDC093806 TaxID=3155075 RepID=UPI003421DA3B